MTPAQCSANKVILARGEACYPQKAPFAPARAYPEFARAAWAAPAAEKNSAYDLVRRVLLTLTIQPEDPRGPLAFLIRPGDCVLLKPNLVKESSESDPSEWQSVITHGSVIRAVSDYVLLALNGRGRLIIADAPQTDSSFATIAERNGLAKIVQHYASLSPVPVELLDMRTQEWTSENGVIVARRTLKGDPLGAVAYDLGCWSELYGYRGEGRYYGADYDAKEVNDHHRGNRQEYLICRTPVVADVFINLPKLKTHKKTGITATLKNLVGINADKNWLPHHTDGTPDNGGDQFPSRSAQHRMLGVAGQVLRRTILRFPETGPRVISTLRAWTGMRHGRMDSVIRNGNWHGNDTAWRMCLDLNKCLLYGNPDGSFRSPTLLDRKRFLSLVDGIIAGEGNGPLSPTPKHCGLILAGVDPVAVDCACARVMGLDWRRLPLLREAFGAKGLPLTWLRYEEIQLLASDMQFCGRLYDLPCDPSLSFRSHFGWAGHVELGAQDAS